MHFTIAGPYNSSSFQQAINAVSEVLKHPASKDYQFTIKGMVPLEWELFFAKKVKEFCKELTKGANTALIFDDTLQFLGNTPLFLKYLKHVFDYSDETHSSDFAEQAKESYNNYLKSTNHTFIYFDIFVEEESLGRLTIELYTDLCPKLTERFIQYVNEKVYKDTIIHRIVQNGWIQGGDIPKEEKLPDECFHIKHDQIGILGMCNSGPHSNSCQFYITLGPTHWMDNKYSAIGKVIDGLKVLQELNAMPCYESQKPKKKIILKDVVSTFLFIDFQIRELSLSDFGFW